MIQPITLAKGNFRQSDLTVQVSESSRSIDPKLESQLDKLWRAKVEKAKKNRQRIYNGLSYRLNSLKNKDGSLLLDLCVIDFKTRECLPEVPGYYNLAPKYWENGCHTLATVQTSDEKYLMAELSGKSMNTNSIDFLGGIMETEPPINSGEGVFKSLYRELEEEAFIQESDICESLLKLIYINPKTSVGFYFEVNLNISSQELQQRFNELVKDMDIKDLIILNKSEYIQELRNHNENKQFLLTQVEI